MNDIRYAFRQLRKSPGFTIVAVLTLALGIGANTAIFSVINAVLLRPLPYPDANRIVTMSESVPGESEISVSWQNFLDWKTESSMFESLSVGRREAFNLSGVPGRGPERVSGFVVTAPFFKVIGLNPQIGRTFTEEEDKTGGQRLAVISDSLWQRAFNRDPAVLGREINLHDQLYTVLGVMPSEMTSPSGVDVWVPLMRRVPGWERGMHPGLFAWGKIKSGVSVEQARNQMKAIEAGLEKRYHEDNAGIGINVVSLLDSQVGPYKKNLGLLLGAVTLVLLIACANLANLLAVRGAGRAREFAVRAAMGASRGQIIRQLLIESMVIALLGGVLGFLIAFWGYDAIVALSPAGVPRLESVTLDGRVLGFTLVLASITNFLFGLWPARLSAKAEIGLALKSGAHGSSESLGAHRTRNWLVVGEIALTLVLLVSAALVLKSFAKAQSLSLGFEPRGLVTANLDLSYRVYNTHDKVADFSEKLLEKIRALPGVTDAALNSSPPLSSRWETGYLKEGEPEPPPEQQLSTDTEVVTPTYFSVMRASLIRGRAINEHDTSSSTPVTVIDQLLADKIFPGTDPIGKRLRMDPADTGKEADVGNRWGRPADEGASVRRDRYATSRLFFSKTGRKDQLHPADSHGCSGWLTRKECSRGGGFGRSGATSVRCADHVLAGSADLGAFAIHELLARHVCRSGTGPFDDRPLRSAGIQCAATLARNRSAARARCNARAHLRAHPGSGRPAARARAGGRARWRIGLLARGREFSIRSERNRSRGLCGDQSCSHWCGTLGLLASSASRFTSRSNHNASI